MADTDDHDPGREAVLKAALALRDDLLGYALALCRDWPTAEDALQEAFVVVMAKWREWRPGSDLGAWLRAIVRLKAYEAGRRRARGRGEDPALLEAIVAAMDEDAARARVEAERERRRALRTCMGELDARALALVAGFYGGDASCEALAQAQRRSVNAVRLALSRLRGRLRACVERRLAAEA